MPRNSGGEFQSHSSAIIAHLVMLAGLLSLAPSLVHAQQLGPLTRQFVSVSDSVIALTHARVIDGTGAAARPDQTIIIRNGNIAQLGDASRITPPAGAKVLDLTGKTVIPGLVMVHEHLFYPTGPGVYGYLAESFTRLYLAGGVTAMRTGGNMNGYGEIEIGRAIARGEKPGPWIDATAPYLQGPGLRFQQVHTLTGPDDAARMVEFWSDAGATSFKAYMHITRAELGAAVKAAHARDLKITGHLCSVTYAEAAAIGIDNLEHGFLASTDFVKNKKPDECPPQQVTQASLASMDTSGAAEKALIADLVKRNVTVTSTLTVFETFVPGRPVPPGLDVLEPQLQSRFKAIKASIDKNTASPWTTVFQKGREMEVAFANAGGLLIAGTDPTGYGGVIPGFSNQREIELLVESGFSPLEAIKICTLNGATYLGRADSIGSIAQGKQADLVVINGDPSSNISDIRKVETVFKRGVGYDSAKLIASVKGQVGLY